jgi:hypothetical protein
LVLGEPVARLAELLVAFANRADREGAMDRLARWLGSERIYIFVTDVEAGTLSSVTRFDQGTSYADEWHRRLAAPLPETGTISLPDPATGHPTRVMFRRTRDGSVLAAIGSSTRPARLRWAARVLPVLTTIIHGDRAAATGRALAANERRTALATRVGEILAVTPDLAVAFHEIAVLVVETCGEVCIVHLVDDAGHPVEICGVQRLPDGTIRTLDRAGGGQPAGAHPLTEPLRTRQAATLDVHDPRFGERGLPRGSVLGTIAIGLTAPHMPDAGCAWLAQELARRTSAALDAASLHNDALNASRLKDDFLATLSHE